MCRFVKVFLVRWLVALMVLPGVVEAQTAPTAMQKAVSSLIGSKLAKRGFAANDPRYAGTFQDVGTGIGSAAASAAIITAAGISAPAWVTAAATAALGAALYYGANLAIDGIKWLMNSDGSVSYPGAATGPTAPAGYCYRNNGSGCFASILDAITLGDPQPAAWTASGTDQYGDWSRSVTYDFGHVPGYNTVTVNQCRSNGCNTWLQGSAYITMVSTSAQPPVVNPDPLTSSSATGSPSDAVAALTDADKAKPASPDLVAHIADNAWKYAASQPNYSGVPYDSSDPITAADAQSLQSSSPSTWPTVGDLVSPQAAPAGQPAGQPFTVPVPASNPSTNPGGSTDPGTGTSQVSVTNWGDFASPTLEPTPTVQSIIDPLLNMWPAWSNFAFPQHEASCPRPSFTLPGGVLNGATVNFTQMCDFIDQNNVRQAMQAAFAVAWAIVIVFIVMGA